MQPSKNSILRIADEGLRLHELVSRLARRAQIAPPNATSVLQGYLDEARPNLCRGWAQFTDEP